MNAREHAQSAGRIAAVTGIWLSCVGWVVWYYRRLYAAGALLGASQAGGSPGAFAGQAILSCLPEIGWLVLCVVLFRAKVWERLYRGLGKGRSGQLTAGLGALYMLCLVVQCVRSSDRVGVVARWLYYLLAVAFFEEFLFRALFPSLMEGAAPEWFVRVFPNVLFALSHSVVPLAAGRPLGDVALGAFAGLAGYLLAGMGWDWLRRRTGSLWPGVLIHALLDFGLLWGP